MLSRRSLVTVGTAALLTIAPAFGQAPARVRGIIEAIEDGSITVKERDGRTLALKTGAETTYADVVPSSLEAIKLTDFIGTASKGPSNHWVAVEIVIIPESMRAGRKGYAAWDSLPDPSSVHASATTATSMTNGLVSRASPVTQNLTNTSMTNGNLTSDEKGHAGRTFTVTLVGSKTASIVVPSTTPVVLFVPSGRSAISVGSTVFVKTNKGGRAALVAVGKGHAADVRLGSPPILTHRSDRSAMMNLARQS